MTPSGTLPEGTENAVIGYITIKIAACPDEDPSSVATWAGTVGDNCYRFMNDNDKYDVLCVESADEVPSGKQYILRSEIESLFDECFALYNMAESARNGPYDQEMLNRCYYSTLEKTVIFRNTQIYTKP